MYKEGRIFYSPTINIIAHTDISALTQLTRLEIQTIIPQASFSASCKIPSVRAGQHICWYWSICDKPILDDNISQPYFWGLVWSNKLLTDVQVSSLSESEINLLLQLCKWMKFITFSTEHWSEKTRRSKFSVSGCDDSGFTVLKCQALFRGMTK